MEKGYAYGMRLRGFSPEAQPKEGLIEGIDDITGQYHDILIYRWKLTEEQMRDYELDYIGVAYKEWRIENE